MMAFVAWALFTLAGLFAVAVAACGAGQMLMQMPELRRQLAQTRSVREVRLRHSEILVECSADRGRSRATATARLSLRSRAAIRPMASRGYVPEALRAAA